MLESYYTNTHVFTQLFKEPDRFGQDNKFAEGLVNSERAEKWGFEVYGARENYLD